MFENLLRRLTAPAPEPLADVDARLALGALLVRLAHADGEYAPEEVTRITQTLMTRYGLSEPEAIALREECEVLEAEAPDTVRFTRAIKAAVPYEDREAVIEAMWEIVMADGSRDAEESALMRMVAPLLGVTDQASHSIRLRVSKK